MGSRTRMLAAAMGVGVALAGAAIARASDDSFYLLIDELMVGRAEAPITIGRAPDPAADLVAGLAGVFRTVAADPALEFRAAPITIEGLPGAVYFEIARQDSTWSPFRQGVFCPVRCKDE